MVHAAEHAGDCLQQLNVVRSAGGTLRGIHVHARYAEQYFPLVGRMFFVFKDARRAMASYGNEISFWVEGGAEVKIDVPAGVAHGVYFAESSTLAYGLSSVWNNKSEYGCRWNDPAIGVAWPVHEPVLSDRDAAAGTFEEMVEGLHSSPEMIAARS